MAEKEFLFVAAENPSRKDNQDSADRIQKIKIKNFRSIDDTQYNCHNRIIESCDNQSRHKPCIKNESDRKNRVHKNGKPQISDE